MSKLADELAENGLESLGIFYGSYKAIVADNADPKGLGRLKIKCEEIFGEDVHDYWALPKTGYTGAGVGSYFIPEAGAGIWICFEKGDPRFPVWEGGWWTEEAPSSNTKIKRIKTPTGLQLTFNDEDGNIEIKTATQTILLDETGKKSSWSGAGMKIELDENIPSISIDQTNGSVTMTPDLITAKFGAREVVLNSTAVSLISDKVSLGQLNTSQFKAVEGETLKGLIENLIDAILSMTVGTAFGPSSTVIVPQTFIDIKNQLNTMLSDKVTLD